MNSERWARIKPIFYEAAEQPADERASFIRSRCDGDESLALEIESLLGAHDQASSFIEALPTDETTIALDVQLPDTMAGRRIGAYEVIREIGRGGMGTVYLASRADEQFRKHVAIKLLKVGFDHESIIRRFKNERQILASLDHPNIARLIDGGTTTEGLPYFVMEYIEGQPIREYCDSRRLTTVERLRLFRSVCSAVHYAHQNLIVHRDIKPGNILVNSEGTVKLLDFGIAKLLGPTAAFGEMTLATARVMTPEYASPEQVRGETITTSSDVYSLGVLLYELLSGHRPYRITTTSPLEIIQVICEHEPERPSTAVGRKETTNAAHRETTVTPEAVSKARDSQPDRLRRQLEGDLDNIVLKAMRKEPQRRYATVEQFSEDIRRYLEGLPVMARKDTFSYRAGKFVRRNKLGVTAAGIIILLLALGVAGIARQTVLANRQRARAEKRFNEVRSLANSFMFNFHDSISKLAGATEARQLVVTESLRYLNSLADEASGDPILQEELATAYYRLGDIQGGGSIGNLGDSKGALESHRKALAIRQSLASSGRNEPQLQVSLALSYQQVADQLRAVGETEAAKEHFERAIEILEALVHSDSMYLPARRTLAGTYHSFANFFAEGEPPAALAYYEKATGGYEFCIAADSTDLQSRRNLSLLYKNAGALIHLRDKDTALIFYRKALEMDEADSASNPNNSEMQLALSFSYGSIGSALSDKGELKDALENYRKALQIRLAVATADRKNIFASNAVARAYDRIAGILAAMGDRNGALNSYKEMLAVHESRGQLSEQAADCAKIGEFHFRLSSKPGVMLRDRVADLRSAVSWYRRSRDMYIRSTDGSSDRKTKEMDRIAQEISRCEAELDKLRAK